jgi:hypothetical protein
MSKISEIIGYKSLARVADCIHTNDDDEHGRSSLYVGKSDCWGMWVDQDGRIVFDYTMPKGSPSWVDRAARNFAKRIFA